MEISPVGFGESLNRWFRVLGRAWRPLLVISVLAFLPVAVAIGATLALTGAGETFLDLMDPEYLETTPNSELWDDLAAFAWVAVAWGALQGLATIFVYLASARVVAEHWAGIGPSLRTAATYAMRRLLPAIAATVLIVSLMALGVAGVVAVGWLMADWLGAEFLTVFVTSVAGLTTLVVLVWLGLAIAFFPQVLVIEQVGAVASLRRSFHLVRGRWWPTLGFILVSSLIASIAGQIVGVVFVPLSVIAVFVPWLLGVIFALAVLAQGPGAAAVAAAYAVWYIDLRAREGAVLAEELVTP
jgi:hypothetical protein